MKTLQAQPSELNLKYPKLDFIHLKAKIFGEYNIIYHINDCYNIKSLDRVTSKHQLLFQKFENRIQQINLILVDSVFPNILSDLALEILIKKISSFNEYIRLRKDFILFNRAKDQYYYRYKFNSFIHYLTFSDINESQVCSGEIYTDRVYYKKSKRQGIEYYPIYCLYKIQKMLLGKMKIKIDYYKSYISNQEANICLQLFIE
ncbi:MAG TPA: HpaII family restriction endonuclease [Bacteroidia bacterium]|jgi:hypothetical protein|nr:HpaII family restriction endonuclease [Bacteroidia bacterium]